VPQSLTGELLGCAHEHGTPGLNSQFLSDYGPGIAEPMIEEFVRVYRQRPGSLPGSDLVRLQHSHWRGDSVRHELVLGDSNLLPFDFLRTGDRLGRAVVKIVRGDGAAGTGFLVAPDILLTNHHVLPDAQTAAAATAVANYETNPAADPAGRVSVVPLDPADFFVTNEELDFTFCGVRGLDYLGSIALERNGLNVLVSEYVNIIQHPRGRPKQVALQDNQVVQVDPVVVRYSCDTEPGSSGSPVFNNGWQLVALHHASVAIQASEGGKPSRGADPSRHYINEGIRLSAIALWLDSEQAPATARREHLARLRAIFRGLDPRAGLFGGLGRGARSRSAARLVVESVRRTAQSLDVAYWDLAALEQHPSWDRIDALAWLMVDLGMDVWCLAGVGAETAHRLCGHLEDRFRLGFVGRTLAGEFPCDQTPLSILCRPELGWITDPTFPRRSPGLPRTDGPLHVRIRSIRNPSMVIDLHLGLRRLPVPGVAGGSWGSLGRWGPSGEGQGRAGPWIESVVNQAGCAQIEEDRSTDRFDGVLLGPGVPATSDGLAEIRRAGLTPTAAALGRDGGFMLLPGARSHVSQVFLSPQFLSVLGRGANLTVAADSPLPPEVKGLSAFEPLAARIVLGEPRSHRVDVGGNDDASNPAGSNAVTMASMISELIEPIVSRMVERLREDTGPG
jgi:V8-like Glu-specific endopeptidase